MSADVIGLGTEPLPRSGILYPSTPTTVTHTVEKDIQQSGADDLIVVINFTKVGNAPSVTFKIQGVVYDDQGNAITWDILTSLAIAATAVVALKVGDSLVAVNNTVANDIVPDKIRVVCTHGNTDACTYSLSLVLAP